MTSCYAGQPGDGRAGVAQLPYVPLCAILRDGTAVQIDWFTPEEAKGPGMTMMNQVIEEGIAWPFEQTFDTFSAYAGYFLSHSAFVVRETESRTVLGSFYVKPNFPGRSSHFCNGGFITVQEHRRRGVGELMGRTFLRIAKDLGYRAAYFNLCYHNNPASLRLWRRLGFTSLAVIPEVVVVHPSTEKEDDFFADATQFYFDLTTYDHNRAQIMSKFALLREDAWNAFCSVAPYALITAATGALGWWLRRNRSTAGHTTRK